MSWTALALVALLVVGSGMLAIQSLRKDSELVRLRQSFLANVSHELKTPLTRIRLFNELLGSDYQASQTKAARYRSIIDRECSRLTFLVETLMDLSRR